MTQRHRNSAGELHHLFSLFNIGHAGVTSAISGQNRQPYYGEAWAVVEVFQREDTTEYARGMAGRGDARPALLVASRTLEAVRADAAGVDRTGRNAQAVSALLNTALPVALKYVVPRGLDQQTSPVPAEVLSGLLGLEALLEESRVKADADGLSSVSQSLVELRELLVADRSMEAEVRRLLLSRVAQAEEVITAARSGVDIEAALERLAGSLLIYADNVPEGVVQRAWAAISGALRTRKLDMANFAVQAGAVALQITQNG